MSEPAVVTELVDVGEGQSVALLWLNRPDALNPLGWELAGQLEVALEESDANAAVRAIMISGRGRAFCAGGDLKEYLATQRDPGTWLAHEDDVMRMLARVRTVRKPVVALINGITAAGGLELVLSCDFAYAAASAKIGDLHLKFGQMGGGGVLALLPRTVPPARARELIFSGTFLNAQEAFDWQLVNRVVADDALIESGISFARNVAARSPTAIANAKYVINRGLAAGAGIEAALWLEREATARYFLGHPDAEEGLQAFSAKRQPRFVREIQ